MGIFSRKQRSSHPGELSTNRQSSEDTLTTPAVDDRAFYKKPTALRIFVAIVYLISLIFLILVEIGNINGDAVIRSTYFLKIDLANIIPESVPNAVLINTIAQSIGLHDFYQVGLWNYCAGYNGQGITTCSPTQTLYWFDPVEIITSELLVGATIALPTEVVSVLNIVKVASHWMFACFLVGTIFTFLSIFIAPMGFSQKPRWSHKARRVFLRQLPITIITFIALLFTAAGAVIATVMFLIFRNAFNGATEFNIEASLGPEMLAFEWVAVGLNLLGFIMQVGTCFGVCCCSGKKRAMKKQKRMVEAQPEAEK